MKYVKPLELYDYVNTHNINLKKKFNEINKYSHLLLRMMGVDVGEKFTGLAETNFKLSKSRAFKVIDMRSFHETGQLGNETGLLGKYLTELIENRRVGALMVGYSSMDKHEDEAAHRTMVLEWLKAAHKSPSLVDFPFTLINEWSSTGVAGRNFGVRGKNLNKFAASTFSQWYLDDVHNGKLLMDSELQVHLQSIEARESATWIERRAEGL